MKKFLLSMVFAGATMAAAAQSPVKFGLKAGLALPTVSVSENADGSLKMRTSFYAGGTAEFVISDQFSIQPGLSYIGKGFKVQGTESLSEEGIDLDMEVTATTSLNYIELPVNALVNFEAGNGKFFLGGGPYYAMAINGEVKAKASVTYEGETQSDSGYEDIDFGKDGDVKRADFGVNFLVGYQLGNGLNIHGAYGLGLNNISRDSEAKIKNRVLSFGLGFSF